MVPHIQYIKSGRDADTLLFVTDGGVFSYRVSTEEFDFISVLEDFVYVDDGYIGVVSPEDEDRKRLFAIDAAEKGSTVVWYHPDTKERRVLYETSMVFSKIWFEEGDVVLSSADGEVFILKNYR